jgi:hypothetical protein
MYDVWAAIDVGEIFNVQDLPRCVVCDAPVEGLRAFGIGADVVFVAQCHGMLEDITVPLEVIGEATALQFGPAFTGLLPQRAQAHRLNGRISR